MKSKPSASDQPPAAPLRRELRAYLGQQETAPVDLKTRLHDYLPLVKMLVGRMRIYFPATFETEEIYSLAVYALHGAIRKYDPTLGKSFGAYAKLRIRGALLDELRRIDWLPRNQRQQVRKLRAAIEKLEHELRRPPTDDELAAELQCDRANVLRLRELMRPVHHVSLEADPRGDQEDGISLQDSLDDPTETNARDHAERRDQHAVIKDRLNTLPETQRKLLMLYYYEDMTLAEIAAVFKLTESRICQLHAQAILNLHGAVQKANEVRPRR